MLCTSNALTPIITTVFCVGSLSKRILDHTWFWTYYPYYISMSRGYRVLQGERCSRVLGVQATSDCDYKACPREACQDTARDPGEGGIRFTYPFKSKQNRSGKPLDHRARTLPIGFQVSSGMRRAVPGLCVRKCAAKHQKDRLLLYTVSCSCCRAN